MGFWKLFYWKNWISETDLIETGLLETWILETGQLENVLWAIGYWFIGKRFIGIEVYCKFVHRHRKTCLFQYNLEHLYVPLCWLLTLAIVSRPSSLSSTSTPDVAL